MTRRDVLKGLASLPVFGAFIYNFLKKRSLDSYKKTELLSETMNRKLTPRYLLILRQEPNENSRLNLVASARPALEIVL